MSDGESRNVRYVNEGSATLSTVGQMKDIGMIIGGAIIAGAIIYLFVMHPFWFHIMTYPMIIAYCIFTIYLSNRLELRRYADLSDALIGTVRWGAYFIILIASFSVFGNIYVRDTAMRKKGEKKPDDKKPDPALAAILSQQRQRNDGNNNNRSRRR